MLTSGSRGQGGSSGPGSPQIPKSLDWKEMVENKYNNRFTITNEYDSTDFSTKCIIIDTNTNKQYKFTSIPNLLTYTYIKSLHQEMSNIMNETDRFIQGLIIKIRDEKISQVINGY